MPAANTTHVVVWSVEVVDREDGVYLFANASDADRFYAAVYEMGGYAVTREQTVCHSAETDALIAAEREEEG